MDLFQLRSFFYSIVVVVFISSCQSSVESISLPNTDLATEALIPRPLQIQSTGSGFALDQYTRLTLMPADGFDAVAEFLIDQINSQTGLDLTAASGKQRDILIRQSDLASQNPEAYVLSIKSDSLILEANTAAGAFRGVQTIRQLIPESSNDTLAAYPVWVIPTGKIID